MFEFHGWVLIQAEGSADALCDDTGKLITAAMSPNREFHLYRDLNGTAHLIFCGVHNHRDKGIVDLFCKLSKIQPLSYGKLHIRDDEDERGFQNTTQEWTMARGKVTESTDAHMSPCIPVIEPETEI